jgi:hypothetical protein
MATQTMPTAVTRSGGATSIADVVDRILDKGLVIDAWIRVSIVGLEILTVEARVAIASVDTYLKYADAISNLGLASAPKRLGEELKLPSTQDLQQYLQEGGKLSLDALAERFGLPREALAELVRRLDSELDSEEKAPQQLSEGHP